MKTLQKSHWMKQGYFTHLGFVGSENHQVVTALLVGGLEHEFNLSHSLGNVIIPTFLNFLHHIFQRAR